MNDDGSTRLVLGTLAFGNLPEDQCYAILDAFFDRGGIWLDTAYLYGFGNVERLLGRYTRAHQPNVKLATKVGYFENPDCYRTIGPLEDAVDASCERLGRVPDVVALHEADWRVWWSSDASPGETVSSSNPPEFAHVERLVEQLAPYKIRIGVTGNHAAALECLLGHLPAGLIRVAMLAKQYDLLWRTGRSFAEKLREQTELECWLASPFHQGWLLRLDALCLRVPKIYPHVQMLRSWLDRQSLSITRAAIEFIRASQPHARIVFGAEVVQEVDEAMREIGDRMDETNINQLLALGFDGEPMPGPISL
jgi:aryl-alcohol dehydrogenase-like predicted oxidoreductase